AIPDFWSVCVSYPFINAMYKNDAPVLLIGTFIVRIKELITTFPFYSLYQKGLNELKSKEKCNIVHFFYRTT
ncbi:MAG: hypothetical protein AAFO91_10865, partial [Bacteroidota bacterium]